MVFWLGDAMVAKMVVPFGDRGLGFSDTDIGNIRQGMGLIATIVSTLAGGSFLSKLGINRSLWIFGGLQAVSNWAGEIATQFGVGTSVAGLVYWGGFFLVTLIIAVPGMVMLLFMAP